MQHANYKVNSNYQTLTQDLYQFHVMALSIGFHININFDKNSSDR